MTGRNGTAVEVMGVRKSYGEAAAVRDVSFTLSPGEILGLVGPNGAGQDHDHPHGARHNPPRRRPCAGLRRAVQGRVPHSDRIPARGARAVSRPNRVPQPRILRHAEGADPLGRRVEGLRGPGHAGDVRARRQEDVRAQPGHEPANPARSHRAPRPAPHDPRRALLRPGPRQRPGWSRAC